MTFVGREEKQSATEIDGASQAHQQCAASDGATAVTLHRHREHQQQQQQQKPNATANDELGLEARSQTATIERHNAANHDESTKLNSGIHDNARRYGSMSVASQRAAAESGCRMSCAVLNGGGGGGGATIESLDKKSREGASNGGPILILNGDKHEGGGGAEAEAGQRQAKTAQPATFVERLARHIPGLGIIFSLISSLFLGTAGMLVKKTVSVNGIQVAVFRALIQIVIYGTIMAFKRMSLVPGKRAEWWPTGGRAILGGASITMSYYALKLIPLGDATTIRFSLPIWTLLISYFILGESLDSLKIFAVLICVTGVVLIAKPDDCIYYANYLLGMIHLRSEPASYQHQQIANVSIQQQQQQQYATGPSEAIGDAIGSSTSTLTSISTSNSNASDTYQQLEGCLLALASSICLSMSLICLRLCKHTPSELTILWLSVASVTIGTCALLALDSFRVPDNSTDVIYILLNGLCGSIGQWFITNALKIEQSGIIALARTFDIEVAFLYSALLLHETIRSTSIVGSVLVSSGVVAVVVPKWFGGGGGAAAAGSEQRHQQHQDVANGASQPPTGPTGAGSGSPSDGLGKLGADLGAGGQPAASGKKSLAVLHTICVARPSFAGAGRAMSRADSLASSVDLATGGAQAPSCSSFCWRLNPFRRQAGPKSAQLAS